MSAEITPDRWTTIGPLLDALLDLDEESRAQFLDEHCAHDSALREELIALLRDCGESESFLDAPAASTFAMLLADQAVDLPAVLGGRYRIVREIGRGGMATVYLAEDPKHARQVAVKVLHSDVARIIGRERFEREIEIAARLSHPHILPLHDSGEVISENSADQPSLYFVSPFVAGESLRDRMLRDPSPTPDETIRLGREVAMALDYAHRQGVVHLDIKPENILLLEGHAIIADFGIARAISGANDEESANNARIVNERTVALQKVQRRKWSTLPLLGTPSYMSPEQASSQNDVDGRSDIFSLGCVLYEMVTGERAFRRMTTEVGGVPTQSSVLPNTTLLYSKVPEQFATVIMRAISPDREKRFAHASDLAHAIESVSQSRIMRSWRRAAIPVAGALVLALAAIFAFTRVKSDDALDPNLIAVAPFDVAVPWLSVWKEGMVDVMSRNLDGAGPLRTVSATTVVHGWNGRADMQSARALGKRTGARVVLYGGLLAAGDSVRANVVLLDVATGRKLAELEQRDLTERIDRLSDSLTISILRVLGNTRHIDMARATASPTTSLPSLKWYLQGEQYYRAARWDSAQAFFEHAIGLDSTFALAYHRLAAVRNWRRTQYEVPDSLSDELMRMPSRFPNGLAPRERLLASIDSLSAEAHFSWRRGLLHGDMANEADIVRTLYATLDSAQVRYPNDPEFAFLKADARARYDLDVVYGEINERATLALFDRAIELDSSFAPAYIMPISLAAYMDGAERARRYVEAFLALKPQGPHPPIIRVAARLLNPSPRSSEQTAAFIDSLTPDDLCQVSGMMRHIADSSEVIVYMARQVIARESQNKTPTGPDCAVMNLVGALQFRGHLRDAMTLASLQVHWMKPTVMLNMARFGMVPADTARKEFDRILSLSPKVKMPKLFGWWAGDGNGAAIQKYIDSYSVDLNRPLAVPQVAMLRSDIAVGHAYKALSRRDTVSAVKQYLAMRDTLLDCWGDHRAAFMTVLIASGKNREAESRLERRWPGTSACNNGVDDVMWTMQRARVFEQSGRVREAVQNYSFVAAAWRSADPELQPVVREAQAAMQRLIPARVN